MANKFVFNALTGNFDLINLAGSGTPGGSSGALQYNNAGAFGGFGSFNGTDALNLTGISITSAGLTTTGIFQQSGDQATFDVAGSSFAVKTTLYTGYGLINVDNTGTVSIGDFFGDVNSTYVFLDDTAQTLEYKAVNGHTFIGGVFVSTAAYSGGLFNVNNIGTFHIGDRVGDVNQTNINGDDSAQTIQYRAGNGHEFIGGLTFNAFAGGGTQYLTVDNSGVVGVSAGSGGGLTVGTTAIASGTTTRILYDNAGTLGEYTITGTGTTVAMATSPTFVTDITTPLIIGGTGTTSTLTYKTTSGVGAVGADHIFLVGNNGATEAMRILNSGSIGIGTASPASKLDITTNGLGTAQTDTSGIVLANTTAATAGVTRQISPALRFRGHAWKTDATAASQTVDFRQFLSVAAGTSAASGEMVWYSSINGGTYSALMGIGSGGTLTMYQGVPRVIDINASSSSIVGFRIFNTSNASTSAHARYEMTTGGASGGDPYTAYTINGVTNWSQGIDNSDSDSYKISESAVLGTNDRFILRTGGLASVRAGLATSKQATIGGAIKEYFTSVGNVTTGEDNLFTYTTEANIFGTNGDNIEGEYSGTTAANGNNKTFKFYFAGTNILNSGALALNDKNWKFSFKLIRVSATVVRYSVQFTYEGNTAEILEVGELTGLTLSGTNILKITGEATATDDIVATMGTVTATPVSV